MSDIKKDPKRRRVKNSSTAAPAEPIPTADLDDVVGGTLVTQTVRSGGFGGGGGSSGGGGSGGTY
jgi:hypothetical protein